MTITKLVRLSGIVAIASGIMIFLTRVSQVILFGSQPLSVQAASSLFVPLVGIPGLLGSIGFLIGIVGLYIRQAEDAGYFGLIAFIIAFVGISLSLGANWAYSFAAPYIESNNAVLLNTSFSDPGWGVLGIGFSLSYIWGGLGQIILGISTITAKVLPRWVGIILVTSIILAGIAPIETNGPSSIILNVLMGMGPIAFGYALWSEK